MMRNSGNRCRTDARRPIVLTVGIWVQLFIVTVTGCDVIMPSGSARINTQTSIGLVSSLSHIEFDKATGQLVHFKSVGDQKQLLQTSGDKGNLFRLYYGVQELEDQAIGGGTMDARELTKRLHS